ncbi:MAG: conjugative transposon protein TraN [Chitinophagaceae bacterium]
MRKLLSFLWILALCYTASAQTRVIAISPKKTVSLIFRDPVIHVDRGSSKVLVQQVPGANNVLLVKANNKAQDTTTLSVVTKTGEVYAFIVHPVSEVDTLVYHLDSERHISISDYAKSLLRLRERIFSIKDRKYNMQCRVAGIYIKDDVIFFNLVMENNSPIAFDVDVLKFEIRNSKKNKRSAIQEIELVPVLVAGNPSRIPAFTKSALVLAFDKFTLPDGKHLDVQLFEENGGRHLHMKVRNRHLVRSVVLTDLN